MKLEEFRDVIRRIPRGAVMTYGEVAAAAGHKERRGKSSGRFTTADPIFRGIASSARADESCCPAKQQWNNDSVWKPKACDSRTAAVYTHRQKRNFNPS